MDREGQKIPGRRLKSICCEGVGGWKRRGAVLSREGAIRARPVHGKGPSHLSKHPDHEWRPSFRRFRGHRAV